MTSSIGRTSMTVAEMGKLAKQASRVLAQLSTLEKNRILSAMAEALMTNQADILAANDLDVQAARASGLSEALIDRLRLTPERLAATAQGVLDVAALEDPIGEGLQHFKRPNGLEITQVRVPLGVIGMIYESRPNVTVDAAALCLKSGNGVILRGGSESIGTNRALAAALIQGGEAAGMPRGAVQLIQDTNRDLVTELIRMNDYLDVVIPRGGKGLKKAIIAGATVPVIETGAGVCHVFIDETADVDMAERIVINAKVQRPGVCNALETLLVHQSVADKVLPQIGKALTHAGVEIRACELGLPLLQGATLATEVDWEEEYLALILAIRVVPSLEGAIEHIYQYGSGHSEAIITSDYANARKFQAEVDASAVYVNASTRFTDGSEFGFGAEIGISTQKLHARGPMGLRALTTSKYLIEGDGQIR